MAWLAATSVVRFVSDASLLVFYASPGNPVFVETLSHYGSLPAGNYPRIQSTFFNPNMMRNYLNISVSFLFLAYRFRRRRRRFGSLRLRHLLWRYSFLFPPGHRRNLLSGGILYYFELRTKIPTLAELALVAGLSGALFFFLTTLPSPTNFPQKFVRRPA